MELRHLFLFTLLSLAFIASSHAANLSPEVYWKVKLPNTPMPKPIQDALHNSVCSWYQSTSKGDLNELRQFGLTTWYHPAKKGELDKLRQFGLTTWYHPAKKGELDKLRQWGLTTWFQPAKEGELDKLRQWGLTTWFRPAKEGELDKLRQWGLTTWFQPANRGDLKKLRKWEVGSRYNGATKKDTNENHGVTSYFFETELHQGNKMNLPSLLNHNPAPILPRKVADSIPFSSDKIEEIVDHFSIGKYSEGAKMIKNTIQMCEEPAHNGEEKYCATSLESMVDFTSSHLGTNKILAISTEVEKETPALQTYTIEEVKEKANGKGVICHKVAYPYAVHLCHDVGSTRTFMVSMVGADGTKVNAVTVCHEDTSSMNPKGLPFLLLNVKPGDKPICHFILDDQIALIPSRGSAQAA